MEGGGGVLRAARGPREREEEEGEEKEKAGAGAGAGAAAAAERRGAGMKFRVRARAPHGVGALLLIGGAAIVGAAVVAWRRSRRGKDGAENRRDRQPGKDEVLDGGVVEDGKSGALVERLGQSDENLSAENRSVGLDGQETKETHQIHKDHEIVADELDSKPEEKIDQNSSRNPVETTARDMDNENVEKIDHVEEHEQNASRNPVDITMHEMVTVCLVSGVVEKVDELSSKDFKKEISPNDNEDVDTSYQSTLSISGGPGISLEKHSDHSDGAQDAESMENTPMAQLMMHQEQLLDDMVTDTVTETAEIKPGERTITDETELEQDEKKALAGLVELVSSPALPSLVKLAEKKGPEFLGRSERGMKVEQDCTNGELKEHDLISKGGATQGRAIATTDRRNPAVAILALLFAMTIGITIIVRLYAPTRATKLQMDLQ